MPRTSGPGSSSGAQGNQGAQGAPGSGSQGAQGLQGSQGNQGVPGTGAQGAQGSQGPMGGSGTTGAQGNQGFQGLQGNQGGTGAQGNQGFQGLQGNQGNQGQGLSGSGSYQALGSQQALGGATNILSQSLAAGTWLVIGKVYVSTTISNSQVSVWLGPNSASSSGAYDSAGFNAGSVAGSLEETTLVVCARIVLASPATVYLQGDDSGSTAVAKTSTGNSIANATSLTCVPTV